MSAESGEQSSQLDDKSLVDGYRHGEIAGEIVMQRLLEKIGLADRSQEPLTRRDGNPLTDDDGRPLRAVDYFSVAGKHGATDMLLGMVAMPEAHPKYPLAVKGLSKVITGYLPSRQENDT